MNRLFATNWLPTLKFLWLEEPRKLIGAPLLLEALSIVRPSRILPLPVTSRANVGLSLLIPILLEAIMSPVTLKARMVSVPST